MHKPPLYVVESTELGPHAFPKSKRPLIAKKGPQQDVEFEPLCTSQVRVHGRDFLKVRRAYRNRNRRALRGGLRLPPHRDRHRRLRLRRARRPRTVEPTRSQLSKAGTPPSSSAGSRHRVLYSLRSFDANKGASLHVVFETLFRYDLEFLNKIDRTKFKTLQGVPEELWDGLDSGEIKHSEWQAMVAFCVCVRKSGRWISGSQKPLKCVGERTQDTFQILDWKNDIATLRPLCERNADGRALE